MLLIFNKLLMIIDFDFGVKAFFKVCYPGTALSMDLGHLEEQIPKFEITDNCEFLPQSVIGVKPAQNYICTT